MKIRNFKDLKGRTYKNKYIIEFSRDDAYGMDAKIFNKQKFGKFYKYFKGLHNVYNLDPKTYFDNNGNRCFGNWMLVDLNKRVMERLVVRNETIY